MEISRGGKEIQFIRTSGANTELKITTGQIVSNFTSELNAINEALSFYVSYFPNDAVKSFVIFSDTKSAFEAICNGDINLTKSINIFFKQINKRSIFQLIPAYVGIGGNECAYPFAKEARDLDQPRDLYIDPNLNSHLGGGKRGR
ncbi:hypothetical protein TNCT_683561 [Trichonephila clavata]|uniref:RNase H type-1 domain-containing protein n=1 Tax=Trichonephila clavata TaxID=2740835 RepID=A0A8X6GQC4_TRICU|nr:hypothetical protein TNCT_683561 [Trichonephila clavata]